MDTNWEVETEDLRIMATRILNAISCIDRAESRADFDRIDEMARDFRQQLKRTRKRMFLSQKKLRHMLEAENPGGIPPWCDPEL